MKSIIKFIMILILYCSMIQTAYTDYYNFCVLINTNLKVRDDKSEEAKETIRFNNNDFGKSYRIVDQKNDYIKIIINEKKNHSGWIRKDTIGSSILKTEPYNNYIMAEKSGSLTTKALIVNKFQQKNQKTKIAIYSNPELSGKPSGNLSIFEIRYIFAETSSSILLGNTDTINEFNSDINLTGWIDKRNIIKWNNRIGVEFNKDNFNDRKSDLGKIFSSDIELKSYMKGINCKSKVEFLSIEENTEKSIPYYANRFPVITNENANNFYNEQNNGFYNIAFIGGCDSFNNRLNETLNDNTLQVAILIDATNNMSNHVKNIKKAIKSFFKDQFVQNEKQNINIEIAIAVYRDYPDNENIFEIKTNFTSNIDDLNKAIDSITTICNPNDKGPGTFPEALFYGLSHTIGEDNQKRKLRWNNTKADKFIILIGDHGNHETYDQYPQDKKYTEQMICEKLNQKKIILYGIQVNIAAREMFKSDKKYEYMKSFNQSFEKQINKIIDTISFGTFKKVETNSKKIILNALLNVLNERLLIDDILYKHRGSLGIDGYRNPYNQKVLEKYGINPDIYKINQTCAEGFVAIKNKNGLRQLKEKVLFDKDELETIKFNMNDLASQLYYYDPTQNKIEGFNKIIKNFVRSLTGDEPEPGESIALFIEKAMGIPIRSPWLNMSITELATAMHNSYKNRKEFNKYLKEKTLNLEQVMNETKYKNIKWLYDEGSFDYEESKEYVPYFFCKDQPIPERRKGAKSSRKKSVWLPIEFLP